MAYVTHNRIRLASTVTCYMLLFLAAAQTDVAESLCMPLLFSCTDQPCGDVESRCKCCGHHAECSVRAGEECFIPTFSRHIETLGLTCDGKAAFTDQFFYNVTELCWLSLSLDTVTYLSPRSFTFSRRLGSLMFSGKYHDYSVIGSILQQTPHLESLTFYEQWFGTLPSDLFYRNPLRRLESLDLSSTTQVKLNFSALQPLLNLKVVAAGYARISEITPDDYYLSSLQSLYLAGNELRDFPRGYSFSLEPFLPNLKYLNLESNRIKLRFNFVGFPRLRELNLENNPISVLPEEYFSAELFPKLDRIYLRTTGPYEAVEKNAFWNSSLRHMDLQDSQIDFASDTVDESVFAGCSNLSELLLSGNVFRDISETKFQQLFHHLASLEILSLSNTKLRKMTKRMTSSLNSTRQLNLNDNLVKTIPGGTFDDLLNLLTLRLDNNLITLISEDTFSPGTRQRLQSLNLSNNPFECNCSLLWFRQWLINNPTLFDLENPYSRYKCENIPDKDLQEFYLPEQRCLLSHESYIFTVVCTAVFIFTLTLVTLIFRYRWHIRLLMYEAFRGDPQAKWRQRQPEDFQYDLFVCYDSEDSHWVLNHLMPVLEEQMELRLCVHQRDFIPGKNITDNIVDSLAVSKRVLALFSPNFAESQWCQFELEMCLSHVVDGDDVMVIVLLEDVPTRDMSGAMLALMKTTTYIEWDNDPEAVASFWRRMTLALIDVLPGGR